jgi:hypothetical protein
MYAAFPLDMKKKREYEECSLGVCGGNDDLPWLYTQPLQNIGGC